MQTFRVTYHLRSAVASAWQADTIFGHLCWALRYLDGEEALLRFLESYRNGEPPLLVSNGFPQGLLPRPLAPPSRRQPGASLEEQTKHFGRMKETRKITLLTLDEFNRAIKGEEVEPTTGKIQPRINVTLKNQISRLTGTTGEEGNLFEFEETFWSQVDGNTTRAIPVSIYLKIREGFEQQAKRLFAFVAEQGYGKRKSVGYGEIRSMEFEPFDGFDSPADANGFVTLSNFVPAESDPREGYWKVLIKYGKLGEEYAGEDNPFKRPLLMFTAGSVFIDPSPQQYYGRLVERISVSVSAAVQYGFAYPVPMRLPG